MLLSLFCCDGSRRSPVRVPRACSRVLPCRVPCHAASCRTRLHCPCQRRLPRSLRCCCRQCHCVRQPAHRPQGPRLSTSHTHTLWPPSTLRKHKHDAHHRTSQARSRCAGAQPRAASGRLRSAQTARSSLRPATSSRPRTARRCARCSCVPHASPTQQPSRQTSALPRSWLFVHPSFLFFFFLCVCDAVLAQEAEKFNGELQRKVLELEQRLAKQKKSLCRPFSGLLFLLLTEQSGCPHRDAEGAGEARGRGLRRSAKAQARSSSCCLVSISLIPFISFSQNKRTKKAHTE